VSPANQSLGAGDETALNLGLIVEEELIGPDPLPEPFFQRGAGIDGGLLRRREEARGVPPCLLGVKHGDFRPLQGFGRTFGLGPENIDTEARWAMAFVARKLEWFTKDSKDFFSDNPGLGGGVFEVLAQIFKHDRKFVAAHARNRVVFANACDQTASDFLEQKVANLEAEGVVQ
jgi:hypothetical protein